MTQKKPISFKLDSSVKPRLSIRRLIEPARILTVPDRRPWNSYGFITNNKIDSQTNPALLCLVLAENQG
jgi:hypothetical protein